MRTSTLFLVASVVSLTEGQWLRQEPEVPAYNESTSMWVMKAPAPPEHPVVLTVAVHVDEERRNELERVLLEVSNPKHANYGKYRSMHELTELLAVPAARVERVRNYFMDAGASSVVVAPNKDMMTVTMPVSVAEAALHTTLAFFEHRDSTSPRILRATGHYYLPAELDSDVDMVGELMQFPRLRLPSLRNLVGRGSWPNDCRARECRGLVTPAVLQKRYKLPNSGSNSTVDNENSMAVAEWQGQYFSDKDLSRFSQSCHRDVKVDHIIGGNEPREVGVESELDIEYIKSVAPEVPLTVIYSNEYSLLNWANKISSMADTPLVHSVSYGNDEVQQTGKKYMLTCNTAFMKAGARGISILFASGDQGVCGRTGCGTFPWHARFHPDFPAGSPYITSVGGTDFLGDDIGEETAWKDSGGGFSDTFEMPAYQKAAVEAYLRSPDAKLPPSRLWNKKGRGYPDVSALGGEKAPYCVNVQNLFSGVAGTSASCPVVAGVFVRLNGLRLAAGKPPMGFLNPFIYQNPSAFQDVVSGTNTGSSTRRLGFNAVKGWDSATGFGTPDFEALAKLAMASAPADRATSIVV